VAFQLLLKMIQWI